MCPECQRGQGLRPWPVYTVRLSDGHERCARCLKVLSPSLDPSYTPPPVYLEPRTCLLGGLPAIWPQETASDTVAPPMPQQAALSIPGL